MIIKINNWFGRLGNNIIQLLNVIRIARYYNYKIFIPRHQYFDSSKSIIFTNKLNKKIITDKYNFFYDKKIQNIDKKLFNNENLKKSIEIIKNIFTIKNIPKLNEKDIIIHIRSGDIFRRTGHPAYIMPPLSFYKKILDNNIFSNVIIISENKNNPVIDKILELYPTIKFKINSLDKDITLLLGSANVIESFGTFTYSLLLLSDNIKNIYKPSYQFTTLLKDIKKVNIIETNLDDYYKKIFPWKNTKEQREIMLNS